MKKVFPLILMLIAVVAVNAKIKITSGSADFLKDKATAVLVMDYSEATWEEDEPYQTWCGEDFDERVKISFNSFTLGFNKESDDLKIRQDDPSAKYRITVKISVMEQKMAGWGRFYMMCSGTLVVEEIATGKVVCTAKIKREDGDDDYVPNDRVAKCFYELGDAVADM